MMGLTGNFTDKTTLPEFFMTLAQYGITRFTIGYDYSTPEGPTCVVMLVSGKHVVLGTSARKQDLSIEAEALDDAFARLKHVLGAMIAIEGAESGASAKWSI